MADLLEISDGGEQKSKSLSVSPLPLMEGTCFLCKTISSTRCNTCRPDVWFCCNEHEALHRDPYMSHSASKDGNQCYPYRVADSVEMGGRYMVATRDIEAGELILRETPLTVGNLHETPPVCLACWRVVDGSYHCPRCTLPMCNSVCANSSPHCDLECPLFASDNENVESAKDETNTEKELTNSQKDSTTRRKRRRVPTIQSNVGQPHPFYECIATLRCLLLRDAEPQKWAAIQQMMDHLEDKPRDLHWEVSQNNVVKYLLDGWNLRDQGFTEADVNHVIGVLEVNAFEITQPATRNGIPPTRGRGVFPVTALMSHGCVSNARYIMIVDNTDEGNIRHSVEVRACVPISKGEEITDHYVTALNGTMYRRTHLRDGWFFECKCQRCKDPSEFRTNCSAFVCNKKDENNDSCGGCILSSNPIDFAAAWNCDKCGEVRRWQDDDLAGIENELSTRLDDNENDIKYNIEELEKILEQYSGKILHSNHYLMIAVKRYLLYVYDHKKTPSNNELQMSPLQILQRKATFASDILTMYDTVCPGMTKERGLTLFEIFSATFQMIKLQASSIMNGVTDDASNSEKTPNGKNIFMSPEKKLGMVEGLSDCLNYLEESGKCLQFEPGPIAGPNGPTQYPSFEYMVRLAAERAKKEVGEFCEVLKML